MMHESPPRDPYGRERPDFSNLVAHFTKDGGLVAGEQLAKIKHPGANNGSVTASERLLSILESRTVTATPMAWTKACAAAFTGCPWGSLIDHADQYSPYGIGFTKPHVYAAGGGPVYYIRPDVFNWQHEFREEIDGEPGKGFSRTMYSFLTPFAPSYMPSTVYRTQWRGKKYVDYSHEREWRVPHNFTFDYENVQFVVVERYEDVAQMDRKLKDAIGREKFLMMDVYRQIYRLWPFG